METIVQWATILSPIIAVLIAWWTSRGYARSTEKKLLQMEDCTKREIEHMKHLANLQIETLMMMLDKEIVRSQVVCAQADEELNGIQECNNNHLDVFRQIALDEFRAKQPERDYKYSRMYYEELKMLKKKVEELKKQL